MSTAVATTQKRLPAWFTAAALVASVVIGVVGAQIFDSGAVGVIVFLFLYLAIVAGAGFGVEGRRYGTDRVMTSMIIGAFVAAVIPLLSLLWTVLAQGWSRMSAAGFFTSTTFGQSMADSVTGAGHAVVGTLLITGFAALISVPLGVLTAVYLVEYGKGKLKRFITFMVDIMTGIPSIVAGLFAAAMIPMINQALFGQAQFKNGFAGAIALVVLMTPIVVRNTEEMLRLVPNELREASYALGVTKAGTIIRVVLRTAVSGIISGIFIAIARIIGESAPLMITAGTTDFYNYNIFQNQMYTLPVYVYNQYVSGNSAEAWAGALLLILVVLILNLLARWIAKRFAPKGEK
ncbi:MULTISPECIES: phosphate ABC transporter permease PstA [Trueperella]|uniref:Phosphate transport system permease protein PstA n=1 Tax=Trueperella bernardiae TaxID=59561 RepID=A0AAW6ZLH4_9ACTO|nr:MULTISPECIES: phosphate ABC transporter permease PstA [Trueperella]MCM3907998.1 phosphate ABC transporter permease PstA [Trueperella bernardiae]MDK8602741.1 phosphate ABC transporter permease PstA [Trueperella bernardiae]MDV6239626.1 phosphate ABC transporter permease PstA [Trueperella bernardiae]OCW60634.1 phosphate ABC transporter permease [Trueperella bernardiae]PKZ89339.1 phosphate ABC transporter, permease protein PstA [Trueperella bernardiae]